MICVQTPLNRDHSPKHAFFVFFYIFDTGLHIDSNKELNHSMNSLQKDWNRVVC